MSAVAVLAMLISKALQKARELSAKLFDTRQIQSQMPVQEPVRQLPKKETQTKPKIPQKPVMSAEAAAYTKLFKSYKELKRQNKAIFEAEKTGHYRHRRRQDDESAGSRKRRRTKTVLHHMSQGKKKRSCQEA